MKHTAKRLLSLLLAVALCAGLIFVTAAPASAEELPAEGTLARNVLDNCEYTLDLGSWSTVASEGGAGHLQMTRAIISMLPLPICSSRSI